MSDISVEVQNLRADVEALWTRVKLEREISDYWYERYMEMEAKLYDEINNRPAGQARE